MRLLRVKFVCGCQALSWSSALCNSFRRRLNHKIPLKQAVTFGAARFQWLRLDTNAGCASLNKRDALQFTKTKHKHPLGWKTNVQTKVPFRGVNANVKRIRQDERRQDASAFASTFASWCSFAIVVAIAAAAASLVPSSLPPTLELALDLNLNEKLSEAELAKFRPRKTSTRTRNRIDDTGRRELGDSFRKPK